jgi:alpha-beta hydrolase superfamily lysophospholipase
MAMAWMAWMAISMNCGAIPLQWQPWESVRSLSEEESLAVYNRYAVPGPDNVLFQAAFANFNPHAATAVDFHNNDRAPLLLTSGGEDHVSPASVGEANYKLYGKSTAVTEYKNVPGRTHYTLGQEGWENVADYALAWAETNAGRHIQGHKDGQA